MTSAIQYNNTIQILLLTPCGGFSESKIIEIIKKKEKKIVSNYRLLLVKNYLHLYNNPSYSRILLGSRL